MPLFRSAFTLVELIVVIVIIGLLLGIALPGLSRMTKDSSRTAAVQTMNGVLTRAFVQSLSDKNLVAIRLLPAVWDKETKTQAAEQTGRQHVVTYTYQLKTDSQDLSRAEYRERFVRQEGVAAVEFPADVWAAPVESIDVSTRTNGGTLSRQILTGKIGTASGGNFFADPEKSGAGASRAFLEADDFLIVFDPRNGVRGMSAFPGTGSRLGYPLIAYDPVQKLEADRTPYNSVSGDLYQRYNYTGLVFYGREAFAALGVNATGQVRQNLLRREGRPYFVHRFGGGLVMGRPVDQK